MLAAHSSIPSIYNPRSFPRADKNTTSWSPGMPALRHGLVEYNDWKRYVICNGCLRPLFTSEAGAEGSIRIFRRQIRPLGINIPLAFVFAEGRMLKSGFATGVNRR